MSLCMNNARNLASDYSDRRRPGNVQANMSSQQQQFASNNAAIIYSPGLVLAAANNNSEFCGPQGEFKQFSAGNRSAMPVGVNVQHHREDCSIIVPRDWSKFMMKNSSGSLISLLNLPVSVASVAAAPDTATSSGSVCNSQISSITSRQSTGSLMQTVGPLNMSVYGDAGEYCSARESRTSGETALAPFESTNHVSSSSLPPRLPINAHAALHHSTMHSSIPRIGRPRRKGVAVPHSYRDPAEHSDAERSPPLPNTSDHSINQQQSPRHRSSHGPIEKKYRCTHSNCGAHFWNKGHLDRHMRIHSGEKPYPCPFEGCNKRFSRQDNMLQHYKIHFHEVSRKRTLSR